MKQNWMNPFGEPTHKLPTRSQLFTNQTSLWFTYSKQNHIIHLHAEVVTSAGKSNNYSLSTCSDWTLRWQHWWLCPSSASITPQPLPQPRGWLPALCSIKLCSWWTCLYVLKPFGTDNHLLSGKETGTGIARRHCRFSSRTPQWRDHRNKVSHMILWCPRAQRSYVYILR